MPRDNVFVRFRKNLARAADAKGVAPDAVVDAMLADARPTSRLPERKGEKRSES